MHCTGHCRTCFGFTKGIAIKRVICFNLNFKDFTLRMDWEKEEQKQWHCTTTITEVRHDARSCICRDEGKGYVGKYV